MPVYKDIMYKPRTRLHTRKKTPKHISKYKKLSLIKSPFNNNNSKQLTLKNNIKKHKQLYSLKHNNTTKAIILENNKVEILLLFSTLLNYFILLNTSSISNNIYKDNVMKLLNTLRTNNKIISKDTTDNELNNIYNSINNYFNQIINILNNNITKITRITNNKQKINVIRKSKSKNKSKNNQTGGFYFTTLEDKGDKPITGNDITKLLDEIQKFFGNAKYTAEGEFLLNVDILLSMFRDDLGPFKSMLNYRVFPKYYSKIPPFIKWSGIKDLITTKKWEDIPDYLLAYQSYLKSKDEFLISKGLKSPDEINKGLYTGVFDKMAHSLDVNIQKAQQARYKINGNFTPPVSVV